MQAYFDTSAHPRRARCIPYRLVQPLSWSHRPVAAAPLAPCLLHAPQPAVVCRLASAPPGLNVFTALPFSSTARRILIFLQRTVHPSQDNHDNTAHSARVRGAILQDSENGNQWHVRCVFAARYATLADNVGSSVPSDSTSSDIPWSVPQPPMQCTHSVHCCILVT